MLSNQDNHTQPFSNLPNYRSKLQKRGDLNFWLSPEALDKWRAEKDGSVGRPCVYSDDCIRTILELRAFWDCSLDTAVGLVKSFLQALGLNYPVPSPSTLCRRAEGLCSLYASRNNFEAPLDLILDSSGFHLYDASVERPGKVRSRQHKYKEWYKVHIALDLKTQEVISLVAGSPSLHDADAVPMLLEIGAPIRSVRADGIYEQYKVWEEIDKYEAEAVITPKRNSKFNKAPPQGAEIRNNYIKRIKELEAELGDFEEARKAWRKEVNYHLRSLVETAFYRLKRVLGRVMRSRKPETQLAEICMRVSALNRITEMQRA